MEKERPMDWREYIHSDAEVLLGKPVVRGTRLSVEFLLGLFAAGWTEKQVLDNYPTLTPQSLRAVFAFARECMREEALFVLAPAGAVCGNRGAVLERAHALCR